MKRTKIVSLVAALLLAGGVTVTAAPAEASDTLGNSLRVVKGGPNGLGNSLANGLANSV